MEVGSNTLISDLREEDFRSLAESLGPFQFERVLGKSRLACSVLLKEAANASRLLLMRLLATSAAKSSFVSDKSSPFPVVHFEALQKFQDIYNAKCLDFEFVIKPIAFKESEFFMAIVRPFARFNLCDRIISCNLDEESKYFVALQLTESILKLHEAKCWHGNLSSRNIFLSSQLKVFLADFNPLIPFAPNCPAQSQFEFFKSWFAEATQGCGEEVGNGCYLAPERLKAGSIEQFEKADLFALGCILGEIFGQGDAFLCFEDAIKLANSDTEEEYNAILDRILLSIDARDISLLIKRLCSRNPDKRYLNLYDLNLFDIHKKTIRKKDLMNQLQLSQKIDLLQQLGEFEMTRQDLESIVEMALSENDPLLKLHLCHLLCISDTFSQWPELSDILGEPFSHMFLQHLDKIKSSTGILSIAYGLKFETGKKKDEFLQSFSKQNLFQNALQLVDTINISTIELWSKLYQLYRSSGQNCAPFEEAVGFFLSLSSVDSELKNIFAKHSRILKEQPKAPFISRISFSLDLAKNYIPFHTIHSREKAKRSTKPKTDTSENFRFRQRLMASIVFEQASTIVDVLQDQSNNILVMYSSTTLYFWDLSEMCLTPRTVKGPFALAKPRSNSMITKAMIMNDSIVILYSDGLLCKYGYSVATSVKQSELTKLRLIGNVSIDGRVSQIYVVGDEVVALSSDRRTIYNIHWENESISPVRSFDYKVVNILDGNGVALICGENGVIELVDLMFGSAFTLKRLQLTSSVPVLLHGFNVLSRESALCVSLNGSAEHFGGFTAIYKLSANNECLFRFWYIHESINDKTLPDLILSDSSSSKIAYVSKDSSILTGNELVLAQDNILRIVDWKCLTENNNSAILNPSGYRPTLKLRSKSGEIPEIIEKYPNYHPSIDEEPIQFIKEIISIDSVNRLIMVAKHGSICIYC